MPSPIAHSITGYCLGQLWHDLRFARVSLLRRTTIGLAISSAIAADVDFVPQLLTNLSFHRGITHSLGIGILFSIALAGILSKRSLQRFGSLSLLGFLAYGSHLVLDLLTAGGSGIPIFWPITLVSVQFPVSLFPQVHHSEGLFYSGHLTFLLFETFYSILLLWSTNRIICLYKSAWKTTKMKGATDVVEEN